MGLKQATKIVLKDILMNHQGGIPEEYLEHLDIDALTEQLLNNDYFLSEFVGNGELQIADFIEDSL